MTEAKGLEEALENGVVFMFIVTDVLVVLFILKVNVGDAWGVLERRGLVAAVLVKTCRESFELHNVLGKSACFVTEYVVDHPQFFVQVGRLDRSLKASFLVAHCVIDRDKVCLSKVDHFKCDKERNGHEVHQQNEPNQSLRANLCSDFWNFARLKLKIPGIVSYIRGPKYCGKSRNETQYQLENHHNDDIAIGWNGNLGFFASGIWAIFHDFCFVARVDTNSDNPLCVAQTAASQQYLVRLDRD